MKHVPILAILSTKKILIAPLLIAIILSSFLLSLVSTNSASASPYTDEYADITKKIKAVKYFGLIKTCTSDTPGLVGGNIKTTISGTDIDNGARWWTNPSSGGINIGVYLDSWGDKNGVTDCNGESDSEPGWLNDAFKTFGIPIPSKSTANVSSPTASNPGGRRNFLELQLGYSCTQSSSQWDCVNNKANDAASEASSWQGKIKALPYFGGQDPLTITEDRDAMTYYLALSALKNVKQCNASKGGSGNLVEVAEVNPDGSVTTSDWGIKNDGGLTRVANSGLPLGVQSTWGTGGKTCQDMANYTVNNKAAYQAWSGRQACATAYPDKISDSTFISACAAGWLKPTDYVMCSQKPAAGYSGSTFSSGGRNACFLGQGLPVDQNGVTAGELCMALGYSTNTELTACINGAIHRSEPDYCSTQYYSGYVGSTIVDRSDQEDACKDGRALVVTDGTTLLASGVAGGSGASSTDEQTSCAIPDIGWVMCPIINFMAGANDTLYGVLQGLLVVDTKIVEADSSNLAYNAWQVARNFANVGFVIVFLIIIFSQISSIGITNYGIKKMLPRLIIAAILVNVSFIICQVAIDASNIIGGSVVSLLDNTAVFGDTGNADDAGNAAGIATSILTGTLVIGGTVAAGTALAGGVLGAAALLLPVLLAALLAIVVTVFILATRKVVIILLVVLAPLAFLAMLLPNTENLFKQWRKILVAMLLVYPMIGLLFGGSTLAAKIIVGTGTDALQQIVGLIVLFVPLLLTPSLLQASLKAVPALGGLASKLASKANSNLGASANKRLRPLVDSALANRAANRTWLGKERVKRGIMGSKLDKDGNPIAGSRRLFGAKTEAVLGKKGRPKLDKNGNPIMVAQKPKRQTLAAASSQASRRLEKNIEAGKAEAEANYGQAGLDARTKMGRSIRGIADRGKVASLHTEAVEAAYKGRLEVAKLADGEVKTLYDRLQDAGTTTHALEEEQKLRQKDRIQNNAENTAAAAIGLSRLAQVDATVDGNISDASAARLENLSVNSLDATGGSGLKILHENQEAAEQGIKTFDAQSEAELAERRKSGGDLFLSAAAEAAYKATAAGAGKDFDATVKEMATKDTDKRALRDRLLGPKPSPTDLAATALWETREAQLNAAEAAGGIRETLQEAATEDYVNSSRIQQAEMDKTLGIDAEMQDDTDEGRELLRRATGVGTEKRVRASAARRLQEDRRGDVTAQEDLYQREGLGRDDNLLLQGWTVEGEELFDEEGNFIYDGKDKEQVWQSYVKARNLVGEPLPDAIATATTSSPIRIPEDSRIDDVQEEALVRRTIKEGDQKANERLSGRLAEKLSSLEEKQESWVDDPTKTPEENKAARDKLDSEVKTAKKLQTAAIEQYASNPAGMSPFMSSGDRGALANGTLTRTGDEQIVNTFASEKVASPEFAAKWNIEHYKAASKVWRDLALPPSEVAAKTRKAVEDRLTEDGITIPPTDPNYDKVFRETRLRMMAETNLAKDGTKKPPKTAPQKDKDDYEKTVQVRLQSVADSMKGLDAVDNDPAYSAVDGRAHAEIKKIRDAHKILQADGAIPQPSSPKPGVEYRRPSYTTQAGVVEKTDAGGTVYLEEVEVKDPADPTGQATMLQLQRYALDQNNNSHIVKSNEAGVTVYTDGSGDYRLDASGNRIAV